MDLNALLADEGLPPATLVLAYGSGAVPQAGYAVAKEPPMLDLIVVVEDAAEWHRANLALNRAHYSALALGGPRFVATVQRATAGVYYNTLVLMQSSAHRGRLMKYGVVSRADLEDDLVSWRWLYLSGRLHKPVLLAPCSSDSLQAALRANLASAVRAALLLLPAEFTRQDLFLAVAGLSYGGDLRMLFGENPAKVRNIVEPNLPRFDQLYAPVLGDFSDVCDFSDASASHACASGRCAQDTSAAARHSLAASLPAAAWQPGSAAVTPDALRARLRAVVGRASAVQTCKGLFTAGVAKSATYTAAKVGKWAAWQASAWSKRLRP
jgi:translocator assembly and maintenance protein 41